MPDFRVYAPHAPADAREIRLDPGESHHLVVVNRCGRGAPVVAFDGHGREWLCSCADPGRTGAVLSVRNTTLAAPRTAEVALAAAVPKGTAMDEVVRQATELGAALLVPLLTERTQVRLDDERAERKMERWRIAAIEAAKQCGNPWVPAIDPPRRLDSWLPVAVAHHELTLLASLGGDARPLRSVLAEWRARHGAAPRRVLWLIGPEGDFSPAETEGALRAGAVAVTLGPLVLRCDTAAVAALAILGHELRG